MPATKLPVTVVIPVRNEERNLPECLKRLDRFEKVVVIDSGSTDRTREIALAAGCEFVEFRWDGKFPKKRNWLLINRPPTTPWVFFLDADEYLTEEFVDELTRTLEQTKHVGLRVNYTNYFMDRQLKWGLAQVKLPIFRVGSGLYERIEEDNWSKLDMEVHEHPVLDGSVGELHSKVDHRDFKGLDAYLARHEAYAQWESRRYAKLMETPGARRSFTTTQRVKYGALKSWWLAPAYFCYCWIWKLGFLDGHAGFVFAKLKAQYFARIRALIMQRQA